jgi:hypothetical protein
MILSDGVLPYTVTGYAQNMNVDGIIDLGGNQGVSLLLPAIADVTSIKTQQSRMDAMLVVDVTAVKISAGNELYKLAVLLSNDMNFGAGNVTLGGMFEFGAAAVLDGVNMLATPAPSLIGGSRYEFAFCSEQNNVKYEFIKLYNVISGTLPAISYRAFAAVLPEP